MINSKENYQEKIKKQIVQKLNDLLHKRLKVRIQQKLQRHYTNCKYSTSLNRFYVCNNCQNLTKQSYVICSDLICDKCKLYCPKYLSQDKQIIQEQFYNDINDPAICGNKQPKIAMLIWVLKLLNDKKDQKVFLNKNGGLSIWEKIKQMIKNGFVFR